MKFLSLVPTPEDHLNSGDLVTRPGQRRFSHDG